MKSSVVRGFVGVLLLFLLVTLVACVRTPAPTGNELTGGADDPVDR